MKKGMLKKLTVSFVLCALALSFTACQSDKTESTSKAQDTTQVQTTENTSGSEVTIDDLELSVDMVGSEAVFWYTNNSDCKIINPVIWVKLDKETNEKVIFRSNYDTEPGETSDRGTVRREKNDPYELVKVEDEKELQNLENSYISYYYEKDGKKYSVKYDYVLKKYSVND